ncbi:hypothetical protein BAE44_0020270 [Dichanthelium oligosanthes]|uniref:Uncharacterized protein n=1 Tax=Dichanthelium oligosanthes TaxID=888268 RepID=A0A1E5V0M5_9POAL|nr:hypothetical protein BAE44_0020270 [Dichanthelium oligosanthes]
MLVDVVMPIENHQTQGQRPLDTLTSLHLRNGSGFISLLNSSKLQFGLGDCLAFVQQLHIRYCHNIVRWPVKEFRCLVRLRSLYIDDCRKLEGKGSSSKEILLLPQLESLQIYSCRSMLEIPMLPASIGEMEIKGCRSLVGLPSNLGHLAKLRHLKLESCSALKVLPDGITKFPQGLLKQLPALKLLHIWECPDLQKRCREGGEVSPIPDKLIPAPYEPRTKRSVKMLLRW